MIHSTMIFVLHSTYIQFYKQPTEGLGNYLIKTIYDKIKKTLDNFPVRNIE